MKKLIVILSAAVSLSALAIETSIAYQGVLRNAQGTEAITGSKNITFALYTQATGGTPVWGRTVNAQLDSSGLFNIELADGNGSVLSVATHESLVDALKAGRDTAPPEDPDDAVLLLGRRRHERLRRL